MDSSNRKCPNCDGPIDDRSDGKCAKCGHDLSDVTDETITLGDDREAVAASPGRDAGRMIGNIRLLRRIGAGGFGVVYRGRHDTLRIDVAVKILRSELGLKKEFKERFLREATTAARIDHPNIVRVFDAGEDNGDLYFVMEYVDGTDVSVLLKKKPRLAETEALRIARDTARALSEAEKFGIVHRDIKPGNILLGADGRVKLSDLGLVRLREDEQTELTRSGMAMGTPLYMSPEQIEDASNVDIRADIYSLGVSLYQMLTGCPPFEGETPYKIMNAHLNQDLTPPDRVVANLSAETTRTVMKMLARNRDERFATAAELAQALDRALTEAEKNRGFDAVIDDAGLSDEQSTILRYAFKKARGVRESRVEPLFKKAAELDAELKKRINLSRLIEIGAELGISAEAVRAAAREYAEPQKENGFVFSTEGGKKQGFGRKSGDAVKIDKNGLLIESDGGRVEIGKNGIRITDTRRGRSEQSAANAPHGKNGEKNVAVGLPFLGKASCLTCGTGCALALFFALLIPYMCAGNHMYSGLAQKNLNSGDTVTFGKDGMLIESADGKVEIDKNGIRITNTRQSVQKQINPGGPASQGSGGTRSFSDKLTRSRRSITDLWDVTGEGNIDKVAPDDTLRFRNDGADQSQTTTCMYKPEMASPDMTITARFRRAGENPRAAFSIFTRIDKHHNAAASYYRATIDGDGVGLYRVEGGEHTLLRRLSEDPMQPTWETFTLKVATNPDGNVELRVYRNGTPVGATFVDDSPKRALDGRRLAFAVATSFTDGVAGEVHVGEISAEAVETAQ